jgi:hypothetical protein
MVAHYEQWRAALPAALSMNYEWPETAQELAELVRHLRDSSSPEAIKSARNRIRNFLHRYGHRYTMPWPTQTSRAKKKSRSQSEVVRGGESDNIITAVFRTGDTTANNVSAPGDSAAPTSG